MRPRDLIVVGAIVLVAGFATADALRGPAEHSVEATTTPTVQTGPTRLPAPAPQPSAPADWPDGALDGTIVFTDAEDCRVRAIGLARGVERPLARFSGTCDLWAAPRGEQIAYGLGPSNLEGFVPFKLADLALPQRELGGYRALFGVVLWSPEGDRVAWCGRRRVGFDLEPGGASRRLPACPAAYTPDGRMAYAVGKELLVEGEVVHRARGGITFVNYGRDGSLALVIDGQRLERWEGDFLAGTLEIPEALQGRTPVLRFDNCGAAFPLEDPARVQVLSVGCLQDNRPRSFFGHDAAWSPDGEWLAVAGEQAITFSPVFSPAPTIHWPAQAAELDWR